MRILVINAGSSSVKFSVFDMDAQMTCFKHEIEIGTQGFEAALVQIPAALAAAGETRIDAIGHRVAHGGERFRDATLIDDGVMAAIEDLSPLAPLHNPPALRGIRIARTHWPAAPQIAVFDTAFHGSIPPCAHTYAVPQAWRKAGLRRYGFHGTSHKYVMERVAQELKASARDLRIISCHLGNGASACAIGQAGAWAAVETVNLVGPRGTISQVRVLGPCRQVNQIEVSAPETFALGIEAPVRISGDTAGTPALVLEGPAGRLQTNGLIVAQRHIHMHTEDARRYGLADRDLVEVEIISPRRTTVFRDVAVRIDPLFEMEMHIDTDEANAAAISHGGDGELVLTSCHATFTACKPGHNISVTTEG